MDGATTKAAAFTIGTGNGTEASNCLIGSPYSPYWPTPKVFDPNEIEVVRVENGYTVSGWRLGKRVQFIAATVADLSAIIEQIHQQ